MSQPSSPFLPDLVCYTGFSLILCHELDAVLHAEWRVLPVTSFLPESVAYPVFVLMHVPMFVLLFFGIAATSERVRRHTKVGVSAFLVVHAGLHAAFQGHPHYHFEGWLSNGLIAGAALCGLLYLALLWRQRKAQAVGA
ncbi:DUF6713 family protein [Algiphilus sp.]|uniref:DUF6713 family protein n=1 Tax=Algiphilus sp. TaxID=1872431 RepID=UPI0032EAC4DA